MLNVLIRPQLLSQKNRLLQQWRQGAIMRDLLVVLTSLIILWVTYRASASFLLRLKSHPEFSPIVLVQMIRLSLSAFSVLLLISSSIASLGYFFSARDLSLFLFSPVRPRLFYRARMILVIINSSWVVLFFSLPSLMAIAKAFSLPLSFIITGILALVPFFLIPNFLGSIIVIALVNLIPPQRLRDFLIILALTLLGLALFFINRPQQSIVTEEQRLSQFLSSIKSPDALNTPWLPAHWTSDILGATFQATNQTLLTPWLLSFGTAFVLFLVGQHIFSLYFLRGLSLTQNSLRPYQRYKSQLTVALSRVLFPFDPQQRTVFTKEVRMFLRDTAQSLQLLMLLTLTFVYLFNFRSLDVGSQFGPETSAWWQAILCVSNITFGSCVLAAIITRFVYPAISLEGQGYTLLRCSPLSLKQLLRYKFRTWLYPLCLLAITLLLSGAWAINAPSGAVVATCFIAFSLSLSLVGLGIGTGAVYARFDWDVPTQITAGMGSLVFMLLSMVCIIANCIPAAIVFVLTCVPSFAEVMPQDQYLFVLGSGYFLVFVINYTVLCRALSAGEQRLKDLEC